MTYRNYYYSLRSLHRRQPTSRIRPNCDSAKKCLRSAQGTETQTLAGQPCVCVSIYTRQAHSLFSKHCPPSRLTLASESILAAGRLSDGYHLPNEAEPMNLYTESSSPIASEVSSKPATNASPPAQNVNKLFTLGAPPSCPTNVLALTLCCFSTPKPPIASYIRASARNLRLTEQP